MSNKQASADHLLTTYVHEAFSCAPDELRRALANAIASAPQAHGLDPLGYKLDRREIDDAASACFDLIASRPTPTAEKADVVEAVANDADPRWTALMNAQSSIARLEAQLERSNNALRALDKACREADEKGELHYSVDGSMLDEAKDAIAWGGPAALQSGPAEPDANLAAAIAKTVERMADAVKGATTVKASLRPAEPAGAGWIVSNGNGDRWRTWNRGWSEWTAMRDHATRYARRADAEAVHSEDQDAWRVEPYAAEPAGEEPLVWSVRRKGTHEMVWDDGGFIAASKEEAEHFAGYFVNHEAFPLYAHPAPTNPERLVEAVRTTITRCEALEDEASNELVKADAEHAQGYWRGQKRTAKYIRRELHDLTRAALSAHALDGENGE
ncbi:hypothetical protein [Novosphingobium clariflavum]|uniref:Uncharacterized protein n=1 Tax=Novosphingobium clariflavum TaxID=2029884 RepID=A0ABV6S6S5_9SPHN|nr:hypothetical protein [Novosphingobium clariflavum]